MILLQILDEGSITDSQGRKVDFKVGRLVLLLIAALIDFLLSEHHHMSYQQSRLVVSYLFYRRPYSAVLQAAISSRIPPRAQKMGS